MEGGKGGAGSNSGRPAAGGLFGGGIPQLPRKPAPSGGSMQGIRQIIDDSQIASRQAEQKINTDVHLQLKRPIVKRSRMHESF